MGKTFVNIVVLCSTFVETKTRRYSGESQSIIFHPNLLLPFIDACLFETIPLWCHFEKQKLKYHPASI